VEESVSWAAAAATVLIADLGVENKSSFSYRRLPGFAAQPHLAAVPRNALCHSCKLGEVEEEEEEEEVVVGVGVMEA